jgi:hypothetical protein
MPMSCPQPLPSERAFGVSVSTRRFLRHYLEMVVAMFLGMAVLGVPAGWAIGPLGTSWSELPADAPALMLLGIAVTMTVPMVAWMRHRGHGWRANTEMSASMFAVSPCCGAAWSRTPARS